MPKGVVTVAVTIIWLPAKSRITLLGGAGIIVKAEFPQLESGGAKLA
jgi:hypothetical protein